MKTFLILSRGASGYMVLKDKKPYYYSDVKEVAKLIAELIEPPGENELVMLTIQTGGYEYIVKKKETEEVKP